MYCRYCGHEIHPSYNVCPNCGHRLNDFDNSKTKVESNKNINNTKTIKNSQMAIAGFVLGIISLFFSFICSILGLTFSIIGLKQTKNRKYAKRGLAIAGVIINSVSLFYWVIMFLSFIINIYLYSL